MPRSGSRMVAGGASASEQPPERNGKVVCRVSGTGGRRHPSRCDSATASREWLPKRSAHPVPLTRHIVLAAAVPGVLAFARTPGYHPVPLRGIDHPPAAPRHRPSACRSAARDRHRFPSAYAVRRRRTTAKLQSRASRPRYVPKGHQTVAGGKRESAPPPEWGGRIHSPRRGGRAICRPARAENGSTNACPVAALRARHRLPSAAPSAQSAAYTRDAGVPVAQDVQTPVADVSPTRGVCPFRRLHRTATAT